ncbi:MAG: serine hydrolase [bacterium]|nr:MAG: serine hydrolase [bacterium]
MINLNVRLAAVLIFIGLSGAMPFTADTSGNSNKSTDVEGIRISAGADSLIKMLPDFVGAAFRESGLPSLSIAVVYDRHIVYSQAFGFADLAKRTPVTTRTVYPIGSITKVFVATMLVKLAEEGVVTLDTHVETYLPEYQVKSPYKGTRQTTLHQLITHTSGLPKDANVNFWSDYSALNWLLSGGASEMEWYASTEEVLASLPHIKLEYPPNSRYSYSNLGVTLLGIALERAANKPFTDYIEEHILEPLGMNDSGFQSKMRRSSLIPQGYVYTEPGSEPLVAPEWKLGSAQYSGGLYSTAEDMARFLSLQFQTDEPGGAQIISADGLRVMHIESLGWGYVWDPTYKGIEHSGGHLGFHAYVRAYPGLKIGIVALTNSNNPMTEQRLSEEIAQAVLGELKKVMLAQAVFDPGQVDLSKYVGVYILPGAGAEMSIELRDGRLHAKLLRDTRFDYEINPVGVHEF